MSALGWLTVATFACSAIAAGVILYWAIQTGREYRKLRATREARRRKDFEATWSRLWRS